MMAAVRAISGKLTGFIAGDDFWRGVVAIAAFLIFWEIGSRSTCVVRIFFSLGSQVPAPSAVLRRCSGSFRSRVSGSARF